MIPLACSPNSVTVRKYQTYYKLNPLIMLHLPVVLLCGFSYSALVNVKKNRKKNNKSIEKQEDKQTQPVVTTDAGDLDVKNKLNLKLSVIALSMTTLGGLTALPILSWLSVPIIIYLFEPFFSHGFWSLVREKKIGVDVLDLVIGATFLGFGYYLGSAFFFTFYYLSQHLMLKSQDRSKKDIVNILGNTPRYVWLSIDNVETKIPFNNLRLNDIIVISAGETIPIDGVITEGSANIDQHLLTGEFQPVEKSCNDEVFAATIVLSGKIYIRVEKSGVDTVASKINKILTNMSDYKSSLQARGEVIADRSAIPTLGIAAITLPILGAASATATLLASFGYNMRLIAPINTLTFLKATSEDGFLVKDGRIMELLTKVNTVIFDKTGTLTYAQPKIGGIHVIGGYTEDQLIYFAASAEHRQTHPVALALVKEAKQRDIQLAEIDDASYQIGLGITVGIEGKTIQVGSVSFMQAEEIFIPEEITVQQELCSEYGYSLVYIAIDNRLAGMFELCPEVRHEVENMIEKLHNRGIETYIISGDQNQPTKHLASLLGISHYFSKVMPEDKANIVAKLQKEGKVVCFVGDGINDSIALKTANVSISLHDASAIAADTAQIILLEDNIHCLPHLFELGDKLEQKLFQSLVLTIIPGVVCVAGVYFLHLGVIGAQLVYALGLSLGVGNALIPLSQPNKQKLIETDEQQNGENHD